MTRKRPTTFKAPIAIAILASFVVSGVLGLSLVYGVEPAYAVGGAPSPAPDATASQIPGTTAAVTQTGPTAAGAASGGAHNATAQKDSVQNQAVKPSLAAVAMIAISNVLDYFIKKLAYDAATALATAGSGQKPLFVTEGAGNYFKNAALDGVGEGIATVSSSIGDVAGFEALKGLDLCNPPNPKISLNIKLGTIKDLVPSLGPFGSAPPKPRCSWNQFTSNWENFSQQASNSVLNQANVMFEPGQNSIDVALQFNRFTMDAQTKKLEEAKNKYVSNAGFKDLTSKISLTTKTPAESVRQHMNQTNARAGDKTQQQSSQYGAAIKDGAWALLNSAIQTFANTFIEKLANRLFEGGLFPDTAIESRDFLLQPDASPAGGDRQSAELANKDLLTPKIASITNYDELVSFSTCPPDGRTATNCVIDTQLYTGIVRADANAPLTVRQAMEQGFMNGSWRLIPISHPKNRDFGCYLDSYCYSNLVKMRRARVLPIGWELAANSPFNDTNSPVTLKEVVDRFNDCPVDNQGNIDFSKLPDPVHPWCRLIDPNWVLKYPKQICKLNAFGPFLLTPQSPGRVKTCVDSASCIFEDSEGNCTGGYGYCTREESYWKFDADSCPAHFASCQAFTPASGSGVIGFLMNTIDSGICSPDNAGCLRYSTVKSALPNGGFEDVLGGGPRAWNIAGSQIDLTRSKSFRGKASVRVPAGVSAASAAFSVLPGGQYSLAGSALAAAPAASYDAEVRVAFRKRDGQPTAISAEATTCRRNGDGSASFMVATTSLGYVTGGCKATAPGDAATAVVTLINPASSGVATYFDEIAVNGESYSADPLDGIYLNGKVEQCSSSQIGCTELVRQTDATLNLVRNPGFEKANTGGASPLFWSMPAGAGYETSVGKSNEGSASMQLGAASVEQDVADVLPSANYSFSIASSLDGTEDAVPPEGRAQLRVIKSDGSLGAFIDCDESTAAIDPLDLATAVEYQRSTCQFVTPDDIKGIKIMLNKTAGTERLLVDAVQLELAAAPSSYHEGYNADDRVFMKVAPRGVACTGLATDPPECAGVARSCRREDVGCNLFTPKAGGPVVPAVAGPSDFCPESCSGYDAFKEEKTFFTNESFPEFLIPKSGKACTASDAGCEEFTNLEKLGQGGENREYYTYLRYCQKPDSQTGTFYTWEGTDERGYQLRTWILQKSNLGVAATGVDGSDPTGAIASTGASPSDEAAPCTVLGYDANGAARCNDAAAFAADPKDVATCDKSVSRFDPDCREFFDIEGNVHYRRYSKTIVASDRCTEYRMTKADQSDCENHGGLWIRNECHYFALTAESTSCNATTNGCRAYTGNASRNIKAIFNDKFESSTTDAWLPPTGAPATAVSNSNESVNVGGHSLRAEVPEIHKDLGGQVVRDKQYLFTAWMKGSGDVTIALVNGTETKTFGTAALSTDWRVVTLGPAVLTELASGVQMVVSNLGASAARPFFIDNAVLNQVADSVYLIKDSWNTPTECDRTPAGGVAPQYMLGCREYTDRKKQKVFLKSFDHLCREETAGCEAFHDTHNSKSPYAQTFKAVCSLSANCSPTGGALTCPCTVSGRDVCQVTTGYKTCRYDADDDAGNTLLSADPVNGHISPDGDTVRVPADELIYLIDDPKMACEEANIGCSAVGKRILNPDGDVVTGWETLNVKNVPQAYEKILCSKEEEFCQTFTRKEDSVPMYFKDPGNHSCEFKTGATIDGFSYGGWFKKGTSEPCYPDFLRSGNYYDLWRNSDSLYEGWAGICPQNFSQCKEFVDPLAVTADHPYGKPYYAIANERLDVKACEGRVSRTTAPSAAKDASACVLFRRSDDVTLPFTAQPSYDKSDEEYGALVPAMRVSDVIHVGKPPKCGAGTTTSCCGNGLIEKASDGTWKEECDRGGLNGALGINCTAEVKDAGGNVVTPGCQALSDSNIIIRVKRDRQCAQWLDCRSSETIFNPADGAFKNVCTGFGLCGEYQKVGDTTRCVKFIDNEFAGQVLTETAYQTRNVNWDGLEFSGYSIPNRYPVEEMKTIDTDSNKDLTAQLKRPDPRLIHSIGKSTCGSTYGAECGPANNVGNRGTCLGPAGALECVYPIDGGAPASQPSQLKQVQGLLNYPAAACRAYPQEVSPFPSTVADPGGWDNAAIEINNGSPAFVSPNSNYAFANVCQRRLINGIEVGSCECSYQLATYGSTVKKYLPIADGSPAAGYCEGGQYDSYECDPLSTGLRSRKNLSCCSKLIPPEQTEDIPGGLIIDCEQGGECKPLNKIDQVIGYEGQCLERDVTLPINNRSDEFACLTWRPVGLVGGTRDIYNLYKSAGYFTPINRKYYCVGTHPEWNIHLPIITSQVNFKNKIGTVNGVDIPDWEENGVLFSPQDSGPKQQLTNRFFGPGKVSKKVLGFVSEGNGCNDDEGSGSPSKFCNYPAMSFATKKDENSSTISYVRGEAAWGILGCYEVDDGSPGELPNIIWPYIGPPIYKDQLKSVYVQVADDIYDLDHDLDGNVGGRKQNGMIVIGNDPENDGNKIPWIPTNPYQDVFNDCNDEGDDNIDFEGDDANDPSPYDVNYPNFRADDGSANMAHAGFENGGIPGSHWAYHLFNPNGTVVTLNDVKAGKDGVKGLFFMTDKNKWTVDASDSEGVVAFSVQYDATGKIRSLKLEVRDQDEVGTFGVTALGFVFKEGCDTIVRADQSGEFGLTQAYTDTVNNVRQFTKSTSAPPGDLESEFGQACRPWGAIGGVTTDPPTTPWTYVVAHPYKADADGNLIPPQKEEIVDQCTLASFRRGSRYGDASQPLQSLFRKVGTSWNYSELFNRASVDTDGQIFDGKELYFKNAATNAYDETASIASGFKRDTVVPPRVASVDVEKCGTDGHCPVKNLDRISVGSKDTGIITIPGGVYQATIRFFAWASHNAMPLLSRSVDWGDATDVEPPAKGWYRNQKPFCSPDSSTSSAAGECNGIPGLTCGKNSDCPGSSCNVNFGNHFGNTPGACSVGTFQFDHTYTCTLRDLERLTTVCTFNASNRATNAPCRADLGSATAHQWICNYRPRVQVVDNWGWCNCTGPDCRVPGGNHPDAPDAAQRCLVGSSTSLPWTAFDGDIRVQAGDVDNLLFKPGSTCNLACRILNIATIFGGGSFAH